MASMSSAFLNSVKFFALLKAYHCSSPLISICAGMRIEKTPLGVIIVGPYLLQYAFLPSGTITPATFTFRGAVFASSVSHLPSNLYCNLLAGFISNWYTSSLSGAFTVCAQPKYSLQPCKMQGAPGKLAPIIFQPSSLFKCAS